MSLSATVGMAIDADRKGCLQSDAIHFRGLDERNGLEAFRKRFGMFAAATGRGCKESRMDVSTA